MPRKLDVTGERYGALVALYDTHTKKDGSSAWMFQCDCGNKKILPLNSVRYGSIKSCGCYINKKVPEKRKQRVQIGDVFGELTVIENLGQLKNDPHFHSKVKCSCGNEFVTRDTFLICGKKTCCPQCSIEKKQTHGLSDTPIFYVWQGIRDRCTNPKNKQYKNYGGRGISVCEEWMNSSDAFIEWAIQNGYEEGLQLGRININGNYEPSNCKFVTQLENARNKRNIIHIHFEGKLLTISEVAEITGLREELIYQRIHRGNWSEYDATHTIPDSKCFTTKYFKKTILTNIKTGEITKFDSCSQASRFLGKKSTYLLENSYSKGRIFTCNNYLVEIELSQKEKEFEKHYSE